MDRHSTADWGALERLVERVGISTGRVSSLHHAVSKARPRPGSPYTLLVGWSDGSNDGALDWLVRKWIGSQAGEELKKLYGLPLIVGPDPRKVQPPLGQWPTLVSPRWKNGHLLALRVSNKVQSDVLAQIQGLGYIDQFVLVTRLGQPITAQEREIAHTFAPLASTGRVLVVGLPGEAPDSALDDVKSVMGQLASYAHGQMQNSGYSSVRYMGWALWYTDSAARDGSITDITEWLVPNQQRVISGLEDMSRLAVSRLLKDVIQTAKDEGADIQTASVPISPAERADLISQLGRYLADLGNELDSEAIQRPAVSTQSLQTYALDAIRSWQAYSNAGAPGTWLQRVETLRPNIRSAFVEESGNAMSLIEYNRALRSPPPPPSAMTLAGQSDGAVSSKAEPSVGDRLVVVAKRVGVGLVVGLIAYMLTTALLTSATTGTSGALSTLPPLILTLMSYAALIIGIILGYAIAQRFIRLPGDSAKDSRTRIALRNPGDDTSSLVTSARLAVEHTHSGVMGWQQVERRLVSWFSERINAEQITPLEEAHIIAKRFGIDVRDGGSGV